MTDRSKDGRIDLLTDRERIIECTRMKFVQTDVQRVFKLRESNKKRKKNNAEA